MGKPFERRVKSMNLCAHTLGWFTSPELLREVWCRNARQFGLSVRANSNLLGPFSLTVAVSPEVWGLP